MQLLPFSHGTWYISKTYQTTSKKNLMKVSFLMNLNVVETEGRMMENEIINMMQIKHPSSVFHKNQVNLYYKKFDNQPN